MLDAAADEKKPALVRQFSNEDDNSSSDGGDKDTAMPLFGINRAIPDLGQVRDDIAEKLEMGEKAVDNLLTETTHGAILDELLFAGNMPVLQAYLLKYSFLGDGGKPDLSPKDKDGDTSTESNKTWRETFHYWLISLACCISIVLRGVSQVYLCNNPLTGVMICIGLYLTDPKLLIFALVGTASATLCASLVCLPASTEIVSGLTG